MRFLRQSIINLTFLSFILLPTACGSNMKESDYSQNESITEESELLQITEKSAGQIEVKIKNPWDTIRCLAKYLLIDKEESLPDGLSEDYIVIRIPIERSVVFSGVHTSLIDELGSFNSIVGICDKEYIHDIRILEAVKKGTIADCGSNFNPIIERIVAAQPEILLVSPYENNYGLGLTDKTGVKVICAADYMEKTPLGRAEWMRFYGRLYGKGREADSLFSSVKTSYNEIKEKTSRQKVKPEVMFDRIYGGVWDVPTNSSVTGRLIKDAGGLNPFDNLPAVATARLNPEKVLADAGNSDVWLIRYTESELTKESLKSDNSLYTRFRPFQTGNIYGANTLRTNLFEDGSFHPDKTLLELGKIFHPGLFEGELEYYKKIN